MLRRNDSRSGLSRSNSVRSISSNAESNASRSAAAAAASALLNAQRRNSIDASAPLPATTTLQRRGSNASINSNVTAISNRPGQYSAVRQTGSRRLYGSNATIAANSAATGKTTAGTARTTNGRQAPALQTSHLRESLRSKPPQVVSSQRRQQNVSSSASIRSFQSDLERINEDYNKTYAYTGQTSASAMRAAAPASARGRRAESIVSSAMSDTSDAPQQSDLVARKKASRVSFSDVDENEGHSRNPSPNPERRRSAMKQTPTSTSRTNGVTGRGSLPGPMTNSDMPPPTLQRRGSNASLRSNTSVGLGPVPMLAPPVQKHTETVESRDPKAEDGELSTIASNSAYSDADEDFKASPALKRNGLGASEMVDPPLQLTRQNLAAVTGSEPMLPSPIKSAMRKTGSVRSGSARFSKLETDSQLDVADDDDSDDSFAARRKAKRITGRKPLTTLRGAPQQQTNSPGTRFSQGTNAGSVNGGQSTSRPAVQRASSISSQTSRMSQDPVRMTSLRQPKPQSSRQSLQPTRSSSFQRPPPSLSRRTSMQSLASVQPPLPPKSVRRASVAGSIAESIRSDAVSSHIAVMSIAQQRVQRLLHPDAVDSPDVGVYGNAPEPKKSSFERKRPTGLSRQNSSSSMLDRSFRTSLRPEADNQRATHRRAASDDRAFPASLRADRARPPGAQRSSSMILTNPRSDQDTRSMPSTPKKSGIRRMSFAFGRNKDKAAGAEDGIPAMPAIRRYSSDDSTTPRRIRSASGAHGAALSTGTLRGTPGGATATTPARRAELGRFDSDVSVSKRTGKPKKFQALRRLFKIRD